jgi:uncharacterized protein (DUF849 family)
MENKTVITVALSGSITQKGEGRGKSPYIPVTPEEFAAEAKRSYEAGATVAHIHARHPDTGLPSAELGHFRDIVAAVKAECPILINLTTGGAPGMSLEERLAPVPELKPHMASFTSGSLSFGMFSKTANKFIYDVGMGLHFHEMMHFARVMRENNVKPELEIYDQGMLTNIKILEATDAFVKPYHLQFVMGIPGQVTPATPRNLVRLVDAAGEMFDDFTWSVCATGLDQWPIIAQGAILGAPNIRTGMEDNIYMEPGVLAKSNGEMAEKAVALATGVGRQIANLEEARQIFHLDG